MVAETVSHKGLNVAHVNKDRAGLFALRRPVESKLGCKNNHRNFLRLAEWNVRTLLDGANLKRPERRTAIPAKELSRYDIGIAALSETRFALHDSMTDSGYTFFWSGREEGERKEAGVGFAIKNSIVQRTNTNQ